MKDENVVPAGSVQIDDEEATSIPPQGTEADRSEEATKALAAEAQPTDGDKSDKGDQEDSKYAGQSKDDIISRYENLEKKMSEQGNELGTLRQQQQQIVEQNRQLQEQAYQAQQQAQIATSPTPDYDARVAAVTDAVDSGDMSIAEGMTQLAVLSREQGQIEAQEQANAIYSTKIQEVEQNNMANEFRKNNPDFDQVVQSGALEQIKATNPMHDNFSAYWAFKASEAAQIAEDNKVKAFEAGRAEQEKLESGKSVTAGTLAEPGANAQRQTKQGPYSGQEVEASMLNTLRKVRAGI